MKNVFFRSNDLEKILELIDANKNLKILMNGRQGSGKSFLCRKIKQISEEKKIFRKVYFVTCDINTDSDKNIETVLYEGLLSLLSEESKKEILKNISKLGKFQEKFKAIKEYLPSNMKNLKEELVIFDNLNNTTLVQGLFNIFIEFEVAIIVSTYINSENIFGLNESLRSKTEIFFIDPLKSHEIQKIIYDNITPKINSTQIETITKMSSGNAAVLNYLLRLFNNYKVQDVIDIMIDETKTYDREAILTKYKSCEMKQFFKLWDATTKDKFTKHICNKTSNANKMKSMHYSIFAICCLYGSDFVEFFHLQVSSSKYANITSVAIQCTLQKHLIAEVLTEGISIPFMLRVLVADHIISNLADESYRTILSEAAELICKGFNYNKYDANTINSCRLRFNYGIKLIKYIMVIDRNVFFQGDQESTSAKNLLRNIFELIVKLIAYLVYHYRDYDFSCKILETFAPVARQLRNNNNISIKWYIATFYSLFANVYTTIGKISQAINFGEVSVKIYETISDPYIINLINFKYDIQLGYGNLANAYFKEKNHSKARKLYKKVLKLKEGMYPKGDPKRKPSLLITENGIASCLYAEKKYSKALEYFQRIIKCKDWYVEKKRIEISSLICSYFDYISCLFKSNKKDEGIEALNKLKTYIDILGRQNADQKFTNSYYYRRFYYKKIAYVIKYNLKIPEFNVSNQLILLINSCSHEDEIFKKARLLKSKLEISNFDFDKLRSHTPSPDYDFDELRTQTPSPDYDFDKLRVLTPSPEFNGGPGNAISPLINSNNNYGGNVISTLNQTKRGFNSNDRNNEISAQILARYGITNQVVVSNGSRTGPILINIGNGHHSESVFQQLRNTKFISEAENQLDTIRNNSAYRQASSIQRLEKEITKEINHYDNLIKQALNIETKDLINQIEEKRATIKQKTSELIEQMESIIIMETTKNSGPK